MPSPWGASRPEYTSVPRSSPHCQERGTPVRRRGGPARWRLAGVPEAESLCVRRRSRSLLRRPVNLVFGDPESGKTFLSQAAHAEALADGRRVLSFDLDHNEPEVTISRLLMLGAPLEA